MRLRVFGGELAANLLLEFDLRAGSVEFGLKLLLHCTSAKDALATIEFLGALEGGATLSFLDPESRTKYFSGQAKASSAPPPSVERALTALSKVNDEFSTDIRYPDLGESIDWETIFELEEAMKGVPLKRGAGTITSVRVPSSNERLTLDLTNDGPAFGCCDGR